MDFLLCVLQYLLILLVLVGVAVLGSKIGIALRKRKDAKAAKDTPQGKE